MEYKQRICPDCNHQYLQIHDYKWIKIKLNSTRGMKETLMIKRIRYKCPVFNKTHTFKLSGLARSKTISNFTKTAIQNEFFDSHSPQLLKDMMFH